MKKLPLHEKMTPELFKNPPAVYRGTPFWAWNGELNEEELVRQIDMFQKMGLGGFHMHSRTGLSRKYLSEEYMDLVRLCCDEAEKRDGEFEKDKRPGVSSAEQLGDLPPSRNAGAQPEDAVDPVPNRTADPRV